MWPAAAGLVAAIVASTPATDRVLVCRPRIAGDPALARVEAVAEAVRDRAGRLLDYGATCESSGEAARAARRAGLSHAVQVTAEGRTDESLFEISVIDAQERVVEVRRMGIAPGADAIAPIGAGLDAVVAELQRPRLRKAQRRAALGVAGGGLALIALGAVAASAARDDAARANGASTPEAYLGSRDAWERSRSVSAAALGLGGAALAAGLVWRFKLSEE